MRVRLYHDGWWPIVVEIDDDGWGDEYEVPDELLSEWRSAEAWFKDVHKKVLAIYEARPLAQTKPESEE